MKNIKILTCLLILFLVFFGIYQVNPPNTVSSNAPVTEFSSSRAMKYLERIAEKPHPIGAGQHTKVRDYISQELITLGVTPEIQQTTVVNPKWGSPFVAATVHNIVAKLPGTNSSKAILVAAHYDSVINGPGASDDGAAVAAMLETIRAIKIGSPLKNDVIFLFTDGEEEGLLGAKAFVDEHPLVKKIGVVINFEARGNSGASIMFETSDKNHWLIQEFAKAAIHPVANSLMQSVYKLLPNDTDMTMFKQAGLAGLNFAYMNGVAYYHTASDNLQTIDERSLQHHGEYALALTRHFGNLNFNIAPKFDAVYFDIFGNILVHYSQVWVLPLTILVFCLFIGVVIIGLRKRLLIFSGIGFGCLAFLLSAIASSLLITLSWQIILSLHSEYRLFPQDDTYNSNLYAIAFISLNLAITATIYLWFYQKSRLQNLIIGVLLWWLILTVLSSLYLPGASYLFTWPLLFSLIGLGFVFNSKSQKLVSWQNFILLTLSSLPGVILFVPTIYLVFNALTISMSGVAMILVVLLLGLLIPHLYFLADINKFLLPTTAFIISLVFVVTGDLTAGFNPHHPQPNSIFYAVDADTGKAIWASTDKEKDEWTSQFLTDKVTQDALHDYLPMTQRKFLTSQATVLPLQAPSVQLLEDEVKNSDRILRVRIKSLRQARVLRIYLDSKLQVLQAAINDKQIDNNINKNKQQNPWGLDFFAPPAQGIELSLAVKSPKSIKLQVVDQSDGLPKIPGKSFQPRPQSMMPTAFGYGVGDSTLVSKSFTF